MVTYKYANGDVNMPKIKIKNKIPLFVLESQLSLGAHLTPKMTLKTLSLTLEEPIVDVSTVASCVERLGS